MRRRQVLAGASVALFGGCLSYPSGTPSDGETTSPAGTTTATPAVERTGFELRRADCGMVRERASVSADEEALAVTVEGTTSAPNACYSARLADATYNADSNELRVVVETYDASDGGACTQCITELDYATTITLTGGLPASVVVVHWSRGEERTVASTSL
ncbi:hypothetical protein [Halobacterium zhouii]|uniref:hypothetical protein n=1 Tax=Halobacterium zhouii TaxID=2902624 RepID=UPI001E28E64D|nr:hypothetical protein [Halobacterium zhouii]